MLGEIKILVPLVGSLGNEPTMSRKCSHPAGIWMIRAVSEAAVMMTTKSLHLNQLASTFEYRWKLHMSNDIILLRPGVISYYFTSIQ